MKINVMSAEQEIIIARNAIDVLAKDLLTILKAFPQCTPLYPVRID
jgi:hypothetical protein